MGNKKKSYEALQNEKELLQKELSSLRNSVQDIFSTVSHGSPISQDYNFEEKLNFIQESLTQKESLLKSSGEFMAICNHRFEFEFLNQAGCTLLALSEEVSSKSFLDFVFNPLMSMRAIRGHLRSLYTYMRSFKNFI